MTQKKSFKVGDRVVVLEPNGNSIPVGSVVTVVKDVMGGGLSSANYINVKLVNEKVTCIAVSRLELEDVYNSPLYQALL